MFILKNLKSNLSVGALTLIFFAIPALAAANTVQSQPSTARQFGAVSGQAVNEALVLLEAKQHGAVITKLSGALEFADLNPYERSTIYQMIGASEYEQGNYSAAIQAFENAIAAGGLLPEESEALRINIAQLMIANGQYAKGAQILQAHIEASPETKEQYCELVLQSLAQVKDYVKALPCAETWFNAANPKERKHYDLMLFLYSKLGQTEKQANIQRKLDALSRE
jgi:tetratricopeptide (TPR) repeat protein